MREILFRGKRKDNGEWVYGSYTHVHDTDGNLTIIPTGENRFKSVISPTISQYTDLTDKNGKKIFEGDILEHHVQGDILVNRGVVEWDDRNGRWAHRLNTMSPSFCMYNPSTIEVIGNIHDNPELLEGDD